MRPLRRDGGRNPIMGDMKVRPGAARVDDRAPREPRCSSAELRKLLIAQIGNELTAHQLYLAIALYFERQSLDRWGKLFREQSVEEAKHAQKIIDFLSTTRSTSTSRRSRQRRPVSRPPPRRPSGPSSPSGPSPASSTGWPRRRGRQGRPPGLRVPPVVHRRAGRGGSEAPAHRRPDRQRHQPVPGRGAARSLRMSVVIDTRRHARRHSPHA